MLRADVAAHRTDDLLRMLACLCALVHMLQCVNALPLLAWFGAKTGAQTDSDDISDPWAL